jgi:DHA2 family multidrug resistance protein-like MFS transporter
VDAAKESMGAALAVGHQIGGSQGDQIIGAARDAFVHALTRASLITAAFAFIGALVALRWLPARAVDHDVDAIALVDASAAIEVFEPAA